MGPGARTSEKIVRWAREPRARFEPGNVSSLWICGSRPAVYQRPLRQPLRVYRLCKEDQVGEKAQRVREFAVKREGTEERLGGVGRNAKYLESTGWWGVRGGRLCAVTNDDRVWLELQLSFGKSLLASVLNPGSVWLVQKSLAGSRVSQGGQRAVPYCKHVCGSITYNCYV